MRVAVTVIDRRPDRREDVLIDADDATPGSEVITEVLACIASPASDGGRR